MCWARRRIQRTTCKNIIKIKINGQRTWCKEEVKEKEGTYEGKRNLKFQNKKMVPTVTDDYTARRRFL